MTSRPSIGNTSEPRTRPLGHAGMPCQVIIESVFATVRNRTRKTKGCLNRKTALAMVFRLMMSAKKKWRKI